MSDEDLVAPPDALIPYASRPDDPWPKLIRTVGVVGIAIGIARALGPGDAIGLVQAVADPTVSGFQASDWFYVLRVTATALAGVGLIVGSIGCLYQKDWARVLLMLNEPCAIALVGVHVLADIALQQASAGNAEASDTLYYHANTTAYTLLQLGYPLLALAILRSRAAAAWFGEEADATDEKPDESADSAA